MNRGQRETIVAVLEALHQEANLSDIVSALTVAARRAHRQLFTGNTASDDGSYPRAVELLKTAAAEIKAMGL